MRKFWAIATLNLLVLGGISAHAIMAILAGHAVSGIGAPDALTWGMASVGPLALVVVAVLALRLRGRSSGAEEAVDPAIAADLPGSVAVNADDAAKTRLSRFARPVDLGEDPAPSGTEDVAADQDADSIFGSDADFGDEDADRADLSPPVEAQAGEEWPLADTGSEAGADVSSPAKEFPAEDPAGWHLVAGDEDGWEVVDEGDQSHAVESEAADDSFDALPADFPAIAAEEQDFPPVAFRELPAIADWQTAEEVAAQPVDLEPIDLGIVPPAKDDAGGLDGLPITRLKFTMPAERLATQWNWVYIDGAYYVASAAETGFPWVTAGIAHIAGAITASRLLPMGSQAAAEARGWREAVAGFDRSEQIDPADGEAFASWINSLDTGDDPALRAAIDGALDALKAEAQRDHALAARLPAQFGVGQGGEAGGIALAG